MTYQLFQPQTSPHMTDPSFFSSRPSFAVSAEPPKPAPEAITNESPLADRIAYYQAWVADERASEIAARDNGGPAPAV